MIIYLEKFLALFNYSNLEKFLALFNYSNLGKFSTLFDYSNLERFSTFFDCSDLRAIYLLAVIIFALIQIFPALYFHLG